MRKAAEPVYDFANVCLRPADDEDMTQQDLSEAVGLSRLRVADILSES